MSDLFDVKGKRIVITGGVGILCSALAKDLARKGAYVGIAHYDLERPTALVKEIEAEGGKAMPILMNVLKREEVQSAYESVIETMGGIDVLINGVGGNKKEATAIPPASSFFDMPADAINWVFDLNFMGTLLPTQIFGKYMADTGKGVILNVSSTCAFTPLTRVAIYSAAKAAINNFTQWLAVHMCQNYSPEIRVNAIAPGFFLTTQNKFLLTDEQTGELTPRGKTIIDHTPMGRFGDAEELCGAVQWLISDASKFVTGTVVPIDGGFSAFSGV